MKLLANENFPLKSVIYLRNKGFDITSIGTDYGELIFKFNYKPAQGVIYLRLDRYEAEEPRILIEELITKNEYNFNNALTVFDIKGIRQRKY